MGLNIPASVPFGYQLVSLGDARSSTSSSRNFDLFRVLQLALYLCSSRSCCSATLGDFITASGFVLWGLLAPVVAILLYSPRESIPWFVAYVVLIAAPRRASTTSSSPRASEPAPVPPKTIVVFFALNFVAISSIVYFLLRYAAIEREQVESRGWRRRTGCSRPSRSAPSGCCSTSCPARSPSASRWRTARSPTASPT